MAADQTREGGREGKKAVIERTEHRGAARGSLVYLSQELVFLHTLGILPDGGGWAVELFLQPGDHHLILVPQIGLGRREGREGEGNGERFEWIHMVGRLKEICMTSCE